MQRAKNQPAEAEMVIYGGIFCKLYTVADAGTMIPQHSHRYDHITMLMSGTVHVWYEGCPPTAYTAPAVIRIGAFRKHTFLTMGRDTVLACVHAIEGLEADEPAIAEEHQLQLED